MNISQHATIRPSAYALIALAVGAMVARADLIAPTPTLPPASGVYTLGPTCIAQVCLTNITVGDFQSTARIFAGGNEIVDTDAVFGADLYQNIAGSPGAFLASLSTPGSMGLIYFGRSSDALLGTFNAQITSFDFSDTFNGHTFEIKDNPGQASVGQTTIAALGATGAQQYQISSFFDVFAELSIDGGPFVPGPVRHAVLTSAAPEPSTLVLLLPTLLAVAFAARKTKYIGER